MYSLVLYVLLAGACLAHYRGEYETRNLIQREEPNDVAWDLVECPVCEGSDSVMPDIEKCDIMKDGRLYKKCKRGTYVNEFCGNRLDCYRGPGEQCSEKMRYDVYGWKCARGLHCNDVLHVCTGLGYSIDSNLLWYLNNVYRYPLHPQHQNQASTKSESAMNLL